MQKVDVLLGLQWGDEGKGKVVDYLASKYPVIARFQGGPNAGHTLEFDGKKIVLHTIPSGVFRKGVINIIGNGVVIDPVVFATEVEEVSEFCHDLKEKLVISSRAHIILPTHKLLDKAYEIAKGNSKIGSTLRGIGPAYTDKISRSGIRVGDCLLPGFRDKVKNAMKAHYQILEQYNIERIPDHELMAFYAGLDVIRSFIITETEYQVHELLSQEKAILAEGAQGTLLDIEFGSYPFVTSSNTVCGGAPIGLGYPPHSTGHVYGLFKAYCTRVGSGPFPTELLNEVGEKLRKQGNEFGSTTGRPRRCGWLDLVALKYSIMINGVTSLIMTKADVMDGFSEIRVCTEYTVNGKPTHQMPYSLNEDVYPVYTSLEGWSEPLFNVQDANNLPQAFLNYVKFIEDYTGIPITIISTGPDRHSIIQR